MSPKFASPTLRTFFIIWGGQLVSLLGTGMTRFALLIWAYQHAAPGGNAATAIALLGFFSYLPYIVISPLAGVIVDRYDRRLIMLLADCGAGLMTVLLLLLYANGALQLWHLYAVQALSGTFEAFQAPAYSAATTMLVEREQLSRVSGLRSLADSVSQLGAPILAGALLPWIDIDGIMWIDVVTFLVAVVTLAFVRVPHPQSTIHAMESAESPWRKLSFGFRYIRQSPGLLALLLLFFLINLFATLTWFAILPAMILARSGNNEVALAAVQTALGVGGVVGGLIYSIWGGPKRQIHGVLIATPISFLLGDMLFAVGRTPLIWMAAAFLGAVFIPTISSSNSTIWQRKVPAEIQGRVFSVRGMLQQLGNPLGYLIAGPLADRVFEPAMAVNGSLSAVFGWLVGTGTGAGMALMFVCTALLGSIFSASGYLFKAVRTVEE